MKNEKFGAHMTLLFTLLTLNEMKHFSSVKDALYFLANDFRKAEDKKELNFETRHVIVDRARYLFQLLKSPQKGKKVIHVAGTSGKGSTVILLSQLLAAHGFKVGSLISPHLVRFNERFLINGREIDDDRLLQYINKILPLAEQMKETSFGKPHFLTICTALGYKYFHDEQTDYNVIETKAGGLYDITNTEQDSDKISVIAELGFDHMNILGTTLTSIAYHKAGIMNEHGVTIALWGETESNQVLQDTAIARNNDLYWVQAQQNYQVISITPSKSIFNYIGKQRTLEKLELGLLGEHQIRNASLALRALEYIAQRDGWQLDEQKIRKTLLTIHQYIGGRIEYKKIQGHNCFFDVAHNPQKINALVKTLKAIYPEQKFTFVISFKDHKEFAEMIDLLAPQAQKFMITAFTPAEVGVPFQPVETDAIEKYIQQYPDISYQVFSKVNQAWIAALQSKEPIVVTGSFYLLSEILQNKEV